MSTHTPTHLEGSLNQGLKARHMTMIAVGGVIGAGFFLGAGGAIAVAGPAVVIAYFVGGVLALCVLMLLVEMAIARPVAGSFQRYAQEAFGPRAGFATGWTYWLAFLIGPASETIAAGTFLHVWFPAIPIWTFALAVAVLMTVVNLVSVAFFGEVEFWLALIKVVALVVFIIWGATALTGVLPNSPASVDTLVNDGGFAPAGILGILGAMMLVMFSYGGTEAIGTAAEESEDPVRDLPKVLRSTIVRIGVLYVLSMVVLTAVLPWREAGTSSSPFVDAMGILGGPVAANIMNFVVLTAALSCIDSGIYATSRMMFSMSREGYFPPVFAKVGGARNVPRNAIMLSTLVLFVGALMAVFAEGAYLWLASFSGFGFMFAWLMIALAQGPMRKKFEAEGTLAWKAPAAPLARWLAIVLIIATMVGLLFVEDGWKTLLAGIIWLLITVGYYQFFGQRRYLEVQARTSEPTRAVASDTKEV
ncbi:amino acid permease [Propioniciclava coleopterorum]|uniref:Amino acid permease n=1 Tax=Propioniciclava coleopterorum TaxID=2714937 RepID=A0A6G7Y5N9_9ACTN|nr:amino acid permease [Propioniciclava coleopterorum]QIK71941.1 amino acid permease [Propioniciclava coleopterorum]